MSERIWRECSNCKQGIREGVKYYICSVSTCNRQRNNLVFCSVDCWDAHLPIVSHRKAWAIEEIAPRN